MRPAGRCKLPCLSGCSLSWPHPPGPRDRDPTAHANLCLPTTSCPLVTFPCSISFQRARSISLAPSRDLLSSSLPPSLLSWRRLRSPAPGTRVFFGRGRCRPTPGGQVFSGPFAGDVHHQVRPPFGLPFLLCEIEHPNPNLLSVFGSDLITNFICMPTSFDCFAKIIWGPPPGATHALCLFECLLE